MSAMTCWLDVITRPAMAMWKDLVSEQAKENRKEPELEMKVSLQPWKPQKALGRR